MKHNYIAEYPDAAFAFIAKIAAQKEIDSWPTDDELQANSLYRPTPEFTLKMEMLIAKQKRAEKLNHALPYIKKVILSFLVVITALSLTLSSVEAVQKAVVFTVIEWSEKFVRFTFSSDNPTSKTLPENINVGYWPAGYTDLGAKEYHDTFFVQKVKKADGKTIYVRCEIASNNIVFNLDNDLSNHTKIKFNDIYKFGSAYWSLSENGTSSIFFVSNEILVTIVAEESLEEIMKIAESINI